MKRLAAFRHVVVPISGRYSFSLNQFVDKPGVEDLEEILFLEKWYFIFVP